MGSGIKQLWLARCPLDIDVLFMNQLNFHALISIIDYQKQKVFKLAFYWLDLLNQSALDWTSQLKCLNLSEIRKGAERSIITIMNGSVLLANRLSDSLTQSHTHTKHIRLSPPAGVTV